MTVTVENINETPTFSYQNEHPTIRRNFYQLRMDENQTGVTFEGSANGIYNDVTDEEGDPLSFTIEGIEEDSGINRFSINSSGIISWSESGLPNYEMQNPPSSYKYPVRITASDGNSSNYVDADIQIYNLNEAPIFTSTSWSVEENQTNGGDLTNYLIEPDNGTGALNGTYSFSISGGDAALLSVNSSTGLLTFNTAPDYETKSSYTFKLQL